jgi:hypothetical protein
MFILSKKEVIRKEGVKSFVAISNVSETDLNEIKKMDISTASGLLVDIIPVSMPEIVEEQRSDIEIKSSIIGNEVKLKDTVRTFGQFALINKATPLKSFILSKGVSTVFDPIDKLIIPPLSALVLRVNSQFTNISVSSNITFDIIKITN